MMKKIISLVLSLMLLTSMFTGVVFAQETAITVSSTTAVTVRQSGSTYGGIAAQKWTRIGFALYDFSDYIPYLYAADSITFTASRQYGSQNIYGLILDALDDSKEQYVNTDLTWANAYGSYAMGSGGYRLAVKEDLTAAGSVTLNIDKDALITALETGDNGVIAVRFDSDSGSNSEVVYHNFTINYDNETYMQTIAEKLNWSDVSEQPETEISQNLTLPSKLAGCDVTWESDSDLIDVETGVVGGVKGGQKVTLTATLSHDGKTATKDFELTVVGEAPKTVTIPFINSGSARAGSVFGVAMNRFVYGGGAYATVTQLNLAGYEEILKNPGTTLKFGLTSEANQVNGNLYDYTVYLAPDKADVYKPGDTYEYVQTLGVYDTTRPVLAVDNDGVATNAASTTITVDANRENLVNALDEIGSDNSLVTLYITCGYSSAIDMRFGGLTISYFESELDDVAYLEELKSEFKLENLTTDSTASLTENLPAFFRGATVTWSADKDVISEDGKLKLSKDGDVEAELTATVSYKGGSFTESFDVTIGKLPPVVKQVPMSAITEIGASSPDSVYPIQYTAYYFLSAAHKDATANGKGDTHVFMKFDLSDVLKELDAATKVTLNIGNRLPQGDNGMVAVLSNRCDNWDGTLTYNMATANGMYSDPGYHIEYGVPFNTTKTVIDSAKFSQAIKDAVAANPDEGLVTFRISSSDFNQNSIQINGAAGTPYIEIEYYEDELKTDAELAAANKGNLQWSAVTSQDMDNVVADLTPPATWYGSAVTWSSSDEGVISSEGKVTVGDVAKEVTLTATVDGTANEFRLTVPACKIAVKSEYTHRKSDFDADGNRNNKLGSNLNYTAASIYANEDMAGTTDVFLAIYSDEGKVLEGISVVNDVTIKKGYNCIISYCHYEFGDKITKVFVVDDIQTLKPLTLAK